MRNACRIVSDVGRRRYGQYFIFLREQVRTRGIRCGIASTPASALRTCVRLDFIHPRCFNAWSKGTTRPVERARRNAIVLADFKCVPFRRFV